MANDFWMRAFNQQDSLVKVQGNWKCRIENINVNIAPSPTVIIGAGRSIDIETYKQMRLKSLQTMSSTLDRAIELNRKLDEFIEITKRSFSSPVVRYMGMYSGMGTHWERSNTHDIASLEYDERNLMRELVIAGCDVRLLLNLDILKAFAHGYTVEVMNRRVADICTICDELKEYRNFCVAIGEFPSLDPVLALGNILMISNYNYDGFAGGNYNGSYKYTVWTSSVKQIEAFSSMFDARFVETVGNNRVLMDFMKINSYSQLVYAFASKRLTDIGVFEENT